MSPIKYRIRFTKDHVVQKLKPVTYQIGDELVVNAASMRHFTIRGVAEVIDLKWEDVASVRDEMELEVRVGEIKVESEKTEEIKVESEGVNVGLASWLTRGV